MSFTPVLEDPTLDLPIGDKTYRVPSPPYEVGRRIHRMFDPLAPAEALNDVEERDLYAEVLGPVLQEMVDDKVSWHALKRAGGAALLWIAYGVSAAESFWNGGADPKAPASEEEPESSASEAPPA